jgi:ABC-2 type transport system ATP-binding protein
MIDVADKGALRDTRGRRNAASPSGVVPILSIRHVFHSYGRRKAVDDVSLDVRKGRITVLLGPNGAGKTTLFSLIVGLLALQRGEIAIEGEATKRATAENARKIGTVFQQPAIDLDLTVRQNLTYFGRLLGLGAEERERRMREELSRLDLTVRAREKAHQLNGGHRRRVEIARALMARPRLLLLDEPTVGLDPSTRRSLVAFLHGLAGKDGIGILWATHLVDEVWPEDEVVVMARGKIAARGTPREILALAKRDDLGSAFDVLTQSPEAVE